MNLPSDICEYLVIVSHPYHIKNLYYSCKELYNIICKKILLARIANKWCWPHKSSLCILDDIPSLNFSNIWKASLFYYPLYPIYSDYGAYIDFRSVDKFDFVSLYHQACVNRYAEDECMGFVASFVNNPISSSLSLSTSQLMAVVLIASKYNHDKILSELVTSLKRMKDGHCVDDNGRIIDNNDVGFVYSLVVSMFMESLKNKPLFTHNYIEDESIFVSLILDCFEFIMQISIDYPLEKLFSIVVNICKHNSLFEDIQSEIRDIITTGNMDGGGNYYPLLQVIYASFHLMDRSKFMKEIGTYMYVEELIAVEQDSYFHNNFMVENFPFFRHLSNEKNLCTYLVTGIGHPDISNPEVRKKLVTTTSLGFYSLNHDYYTYLCLKSDLPTNKDKWNNSRNRFGLHRGKYIVSGGYLENVIPCVLIISQFTKASMSSSIGYGIYTPVYCIPKDELGNAKRLWQAPLPTANSCEEVLNTPGIPGDIKPTKPNDCLCIDNEYYGVWLVNDNSCDNGQTLLWTDQIKESCDGFQLNSNAELDLYEYERQYRPIIAKDTAFIDENGKTVFPITYRENKGYFEYADNVCGADGKYWTKPDGEIGYEYEGCGGNYNFKVTNVFEAKLEGATSCDDVFSTIGIKGSYPDVCVKRDDNFYGIWSFYETGNLNACPNKLEFKYMSNTCTNGQGYSWYKLTGTNKNLTPEENLAVAKSLKLKAWGYNTPIEPDQAYLDCNEEPVCGWNYGPCSGNPYPFTIFLIVIVIIVIIFLVLAYLYLRRRFVAPVPTVVEVIPMAPVATSTTVTQQRYVPVEIIQPICETVYVCETYDCNIPQEETCNNERTYTYTEVERSVGQDYEITYWDE